jgi:hypothetical protein
VRVDVMLVTERRDLRDGLGRRASETQGLLGPADAPERLELRPQREDEPAVAAARAAAADVAFDERDVQRRLAVLERERGPEAGEPTADDADVGAGVAVQRRLVLGPGEGLLEPEAPVAPPMRALRSDTGSSPS